MWSYERDAGMWGINLPDRLLRFLGVSALFHLVALPGTYWAWRHYVDSGDWNRGDRLPWPLYFIVLAYSAAPIIAGLLLGRSSRDGGWLSQIVLGERVPPRAWDYFFTKRPDGWMRLKLKSGSWIGGAYAQGSYAAGYPEPQDIYLVDAVDVDADTGEFELGTDDEVQFRGSSLLVRWDEIEYLEFHDA